MYKSICVIGAVLVAVSALPQHPIPVISRSDVRDNYGQFSYTLLTGNGISQAEQGALKLTQQGDDYVLVKQGQVSYTSPEGIPITLMYTADENGFHAKGNHLPKPVQPLPVPQ